MADGNPIIAHLLDVDNEPFCSARRPAVALYADTVDPADAPPFEADVWCAECWQAAGYDEGDEGENERVDEAAARFEARQHRAMAESIGTDDEPDDPAPHVVVSEEELAVERAAHRWESCQWCQTFAHAPGGDLQRCQCVICKAEYATPLSLGQEASEALGKAAMAVHQILSWAEGKGEGLTEEQELVAQVASAALNDIHGNVLASFVAPYVEDDEALYRETEAREWDAVDQVDDRALLDS